MTAISVLGSNPLWYLTRGSGVVAFLLLTGSFALGLAATKRGLASRGWPRFATQLLHRNVSLLALAFLVVHIITTLADTFVTVGWWAWIVPGASGYRTAWVALGTLSFDLIVVLIVTSLLRDRMSARTWRAVHWAAYAAWPLAFLHFLETGTDAGHGGWGLYLAVGCLLVLAVAAGARWFTNDAPSGPLRSVTGRTR